MLMDDSAGPNRVDLKTHFPRGIVRGRALVSVTLQAGEVGPISELVDPKYAWMIGAQKKLHCMSRLSER